jgi:hypothetical protein
MDKSDEIMSAALLKQFTEKRLPRAFELEKKVLANKTLSESDLMFLEMVLNDAQYILRFVDKHPEYQEMASKAIKLYSDITQKALDNENEKKNKNIYP